MALGAIQLYYATNDNKYLTSAAEYAAQYISDGNTDAINLYDIGAISLYEIFKAIKANPISGLAVSQSTVLAAMKDQLKTGLSESSSDAFHFAEKYDSGNDLVPSGFGYWLEASLYEEISGLTTYSSMKTQQRDWIFGNNAWGTSFVVGAGSVFLNCLQHQVANLVGSLTGTGNILLGAVSDGPSDTANFNGLGGAPDGAKSCPSKSGDIYSIFTGQGVRVEDNVASWPSSEPADDYTVTGLYMFARLASQYANQVS